MVDQSATGCIHHASGNEENSRALHIVEFLMATLIHVQMNIYMQTRSLQMLQAIYFIQFSLLILFLCLDKLELHGIFEMHVYIDYWWNLVQKWYRQRLKVYVSFIHICIKILLKT